MCGLAGIVDFQNSSGRDILAGMTGSLAHRGPDDSGLHEWKTNHAYIGFGHRRLSILDLSELGHQPMLINNGELGIVLNGEIYNFQEIRQELVKHGHSFNSNSDTEVVLHAYLEWGTDAVQKFIGMFAFVIYDSRKQSIYLFRDRAGVKPLYYYQQDGLILFASELKAFHNHPLFKKEISHNVVGDYFKHGWIPAPHTIYQGCYKLMPGNYLEIDLEKRTTTTSEYWNILTYYQNKSILNEEETISQIEDLLKSSFNYRMVSDVPVGIFLSGGYDSSAVAALLQKDTGNKLQTFTIGFEEAEFNEATYAKEVANYLGTNHHEYICSYKDATDLVPELSTYYDEPFADSSAVPTMLVSKMAASHVKVALSADGGDELFCGYPRYYTNLKQFEKTANIGYSKSKYLRYLASMGKHFAYSMNKQELGQKLLKIEKMFATRDSLSRYRYRIEPYHFKEFELRSLLQKDFSEIRSNYDEFTQLGGSDMLNNMMAIEYKTTLVDDMLVKVDRASMSKHLECREPFLDHRLSEFMASVPSSLKYKDNIPKYLLKKIVHKYLPKEMMDRPKMGFGIPTEHWLKNELKPLVLDLLMDSKNPTFNAKALNRYINGFYNGKEGNAEKVWFLLMYEQWYRKWQ